MGSALWDSLSGSLVAKTVEYSEFQAWRAEMPPPPEQLGCRRLVGMERSRDKVTKEDWEG